MVFVAALATLWWGIAGASHSPAPASVTVAGSLQSEVGCPGDWQPECLNTAMTFDANDGVWQKTLNLPAGSYDYKAALNGAWVEAYPPVQIAFALPGPFTVRFYYDHETHFVTDSISSVIVVAAGSFQSELGCPGDFDPGCLRSWLKDADGDGVYTFETTALPPGSYDALAAINESWDESYGLGGVPGQNIPFEVTSPGEPVSFSYVAATHILTITTPASSATPTPSPTETVPVTQEPTVTVPAASPEPSASASPTPPVTGSPGTPIDDPTPPSVPRPHKVRLPMLAND